MHVFTESDMAQACVGVGIPWRCLYVKLSRLLELAPCPFTEAGSLCSPDLKAQEVGMAVQLSMLKTAARQVLTGLSLDCGSVAAADWGAVVSWHGCHPGGTPGGI